jgi:hypothetical protein
VPALELVSEQAAFAGCLNFRDLGGHVTGVGQRIPPRLLFRSDYIAEPGKPRGDRQAGSRLETVIDLRSESEVRHAEFETTAVRLHLPLDNPQRGMTSEDWSNPNSVAERYVELLINGADSSSPLILTTSDSSSTGCE